MKGVTLFGWRIPARQVAGGLVFWAVIGAVVISTRNLPFWYEGAPGPRFMPLALAALFALLTVLYWIEAATKAPDDEVDDERSFLRPAAFVAITVTLALAWESLGAVLAVLACAFLELKFLEGFSWLRSAVASVCVSAAVLVLFQIVLGVQLPGGLLEMLSYVRM